MTTTRIMLASVGLLLSACGGTTTPAADQTATLNVVISDNPETKLAIAPLNSQALFVHHKTFGQNYFHGRLSGTHQVEISKNGREWIALGPVEVPDGTYAYLRLTSSAGRAELEAGAEIGGQNLDSAVWLELGEAGELVVQMHLSNPIFPAPGSDVTLAIDLNAEAWISEENVEAGRIPATDIETAISITPHQLFPAVIVPAPERRT